MLGIGGMNPRYKFLTYAVQWYSIGCPTTHNANG